MSEQVLAFSFECEGWGCRAVALNPLPPGLALTWWVGAQIMRAYGRCMV